MVYIKEGDSSMVAELCRIVIGAVLLVAGVLKVADFGTFVASLKAYRLIGNVTLNRVVAAVIAFAELGLGTAVLGGWLFPLTGVLALSMLGTFTMVAAVMVLSGRRRTNCGCMVFGRDKALGWYICLRNLAFMSLLVPSVLPVPTFPLLGMGALLLVASVLSMNMEKIRIHIALEHKM